MSDGQVIESEIPATQEEDKPSSVRDELLKAFEDVTAEPETTAAAKTGEPKTAAERARDDQGRFAQGQKTETAKPGSVTPVKTGAAPEESAQATASTVAPVEPPAHWSEADKTKFKSVPPDSQAWVMERHRAMEGDYTRKMQAISTFTKEYEPVEQLFKPYERDLAARGQTKAGLINAWAQAELRLNANPVDGILHIARAYSVTPEMLAQAPQQNPGAGAPQQQMSDPRITLLLQRVEGFEQAQQQQRLTTARSGIDNFATMKGADGSPLHPHFDEVVEDMAHLAQAERAAGRVPDMQKLYDKAVWSSDAVREKLLNARDTEAQKKATEAAKTKSASARRAGSSVSGAPSGPAQTTKPTGNSVRESLLAAVEQHDGA